MEIKDVIVNVEQRMVLKCVSQQLDLLDEIQEYLETNGKESTIEFIRALKDSLK